MPLDEAMPADPPLLAVLDDLAGRGIEGQLRAVDGGDVQCLTCRQTTPAAGWEILSLTRLEGVSDPADMLAVVAMRCPSCATDGVLVAHYGAESSVEEAEVLVALDRHPAGGEPPDVPGEPPLPPDASP